MSFHGLGLLAPKEYELDLSNEVLYSFVGQEAAKIQEVKVDGRKKLPTGPDSTPTSLGPAEPSDFLSTSKLDL